MLDVCHRQWDGRSCFYYPQIHFYYFIIDSKILKIYSEIFSVSSILKISKMTVKKLEEERFELAKKPWYGFFPSCLYSCDFARKHVGCPPSWINSLSGDVTSGISLLKRYS